jgi:hypothetical protein
MWAQLHQDFEVASYVRLLVVAEQPGSPVATWTQVKQFAESLGLSVSGMQRNKWTIAKVDQDDAPSTLSVAPVLSLADKLKDFGDDE